jgi:hypothetical protein
MAYMNNRPNQNRNFDFKQEKFDAQPPLLCFDRNPIVGKTYIIRPELLPYNPTPNIFRVRVTAIMRETVVLKRLDNSKELRRKYVIWTPDVLTED